MVWIYLTVSIEWFSTLFSLLLKSWGDSIPSLKIILIAERLFLVPLYESSSLWSLAGMFERSCSRDFDPFSMLQFQSKSQLVPLASWPKRGNFHSFASITSSSLGMMILFRSVSTRFFYRVASVSACFFCSLISRLILTSWVGIFSAISFAYFSWKRLSLLMYLSILCMPFTFG